MSYTFFGLIVNNPSMATIISLKKNGLKYTSHTDPCYLILINADKEIIDKYTSLKINDKTLFLEYDTWAGSIDVCRGHYIVNGVIDESSKIEGEHPDADNVFINLFSGIKIQLNKDCYFKPFDRHE